MRRVELALLVLVGCTPPPSAPVGVTVAPAFASTVAVPDVAPPPSPVAPPGPVDVPPPPRPPVAVATADQTMDRILASGGPALREVLATPEKYRFQILYGVIQKDKLERHGYRADAEYFFPASSMKMPISLATFERLAQLQISRDATLKMFPVDGAEPPFSTTIARETLRSLVVSDNFSANRLLAFVGHREVNETLWALGLASARVRTGFATGDEIDPAEVSPRIEVAGGKELAARRSTLVLPANDAKGLAIGEATIVDGKRVPGPLSFAEKNAIRLSDLQDTLVRIMRPELLAPSKKKGAAKPEDLTYLRETLGTLPSASGLAGYQRNVVADYQLIPFLRGIERVRPRGQFVIYSKVGQAFGFLVANAYVVDKVTGRAFFLTATVYANPDETMNDDAYAYDTISFPALADIGEAFARHAFNP